jgi:hypothetical protein
MATYISTRRALHKYPNKWFVESGTFMGDGIQDALKCRFQNIISYEIVDYLAKMSAKRFEDNPNVRVVNKSSVNMFSDIKNIKEPITFWLDGHYSSHYFGHETGYDKDHVCPLMLELEAIQQHPIKTHTILIDDRRMMKKTGKIDTYLQVTEDEVIRKLKEINPWYTIKYERGGVKNDILVAVYDPFAYKIKAVKFQ